MQTEPSKTRYTLIENESDLLEATSKLKKEKIVAFDLEADSMFRFKEKVCLLQIATRHRIFLVDTLKTTDLAPLKPIFSDPDIQKVFHGADYDVRSLYRDYQIEIFNLFDTEIACRFLGLKETGLNAVVKNRFCIALDKKFQKKDWSRRPLTEEMLAYAANDVLYLIPLAGFLKKELRIKGRLPWVKEECDLLSKVRPPAPNNKPLYVKLKGAGRLDRRSLGILEELLQLRIKIAASKDRPLFKIFSNKSLMVIARTGPIKQEQLIGLKELSRRQVEMYGDALINAVLTARSIPENKLPEYPRNKIPRLGPTVPPTIKILKEWRDGKAEELSFDPGLLMNKALMTAIALNKPVGLEGLKAIPEMKDWQTMQFGRDILRLLKTLPEASGH